MVLLKDTLIAHSMLTQDSIQARLGGNSLPTTIPDLDPIVTNLSDLVTMQKHTGDTISASLHLSVVFLPVTLAVADSGVHLAFDLTHGLNCVDSGSIAGMGVKVNPLGDQCCLSDGGGCQRNFNTFQVQPSQLRIDSLADSISWFFET